MGSVEDNTSGGSYGYRMSKAALNIAGKSLSLDLLHKGIAVLVLHPGFVKTDMTKLYWGEKGIISPATSAQVCNSLYELCAYFYRDLYLNQ